MIRAGEKLFEESFSPHPSSKTFIKMVGLIFNEIL
jgi:hypothetical protein